MNLNRRMFLQNILAGSAALAVAPNASAALLDGILFNPCGTSLPQHLAGHPLVAAAWEGIDPARFWDTHAHIAGIGDSGSGIFTSPDMNSLWHPIQYAQHKFYLNAACTEKGRVDQSYIERMKHLIAELNHTASAKGEDAKQPHARLMLFAFEQAYDEVGNAQSAQTAFHVPNAYALKIAQSSPENFEWVCSIHPYRHDAVEALEAAVAQGARAVKWLPSVMGIDPASPRCDAFYRSLARLNVPLICHAGEEKAVDGMGFHDANNPLKMRRALDAGVRVVVAHCASIGEDIDLDKGKHGPHVASIELFARLMADANYQKNLFGDISAIVMRNRSIATLRSIIEHQDWHDRLLNGSDYPLPGVLPLYTTGKLAKAGLLDSAAVPVLDEIQRYNPLLFDFVLKRQLRSGTQKLPQSIFHTRDFFLRGKT
ncbi:MAG: amidohydrolase family protein [Gallionellaceae bacterium]